MGWPVTGIIALSLSYRKFAKYTYDCLISFKGPFEYASENKTTTI